MPVYYIILNYKYLSRTDKDGTVFKQIVLRLISISANGFFKSLIVIYLIKEMILNLKLLIILV